MSRAIVLAVVCAVGAVGIGGGLSAASADGRRAAAEIALPARAAAETPPPGPIAPRTIITPDAPVYFFQGSYYTYTNGAWFVAGRHTGPWDRVSGPPPWVRDPRGSDWREGRLRGPRHD